MEEHCWPPLSYELAMEQYRRDYLDQEEEEEEGDGRMLLRSAGFNRDVIDTYSTVTFSIIISSHLTGLCGARGWYKFAG